MKKLSVFALGFLISTAAGAAKITSGAEILSENVGNMLTESVRINLSAGTNMHYGTNVDDNGIGLAACNVNGRKRTVTIQVPDPEDPESTKPEEVTGGTYFATSSHGGSLVQQGGVCADDTLSAAATEQAALPANE